MKRFIKYLTFGLITLLILLILLILGSNSWFHYQSIKRLEERPVGIIAEKAVVVSAHPLASSVGLEILKKGGNAFDAAVAAQYALAVTYPRAGNIGGGGFLVYRTREGEIGSLDYRETAPGLSHKDMYLDDNGKVIKNLSTEGHLAVGVPGTVDGMFSLYKKFGTLPFEELIQPAIDLAHNGVKLTKREADGLNNYKEQFLALNTHSPYLVKDEPWKKGDLLHHEGLAKTLERIRDLGRDGFYRGKTAELLVSEMKRGNGLINMEDLASYRSIWRAPIVFNYKKYRVISMAPPSSGGIALAQLLRMTEGLDLKSLGHNTAPSIHLMTELERRVYADRAAYLGDPEFFNVPVEALLDEGYLLKRLAGIDLNIKTDSKAVKEGKLAPTESMETTHFSIVDRWGNAVSATTTLNGNYGSKVIVQGAGFLLNNEMDDFSIKPGTANMFGLVGGEANAIAPGKRMLSSMTPTILEKDGKLFMIVGTPGGSTIITSVYQTILNVLEHEMSLQQAVSAGRVHSQWLPDVIIPEKGALGSFDLLQLLLKGHLPVIYPIFNTPLGAVEAILVRPDGTYEGAADFTRGIDDTALGY